MPPDEGPNEGRISSGVAITTAPVTARAPDEGARGSADLPQTPDEAARTSGDPTEFVAELRTIAELHASGALTDEEFARAKARVLS